MHFSIYIRDGLQTAIVGENNNYFLRLSIAYYFNRTWLDNKFAATTIYQSTAVVCNVSSHLMALAGRRQLIPGNMIWRTISVLRYMDNYRNIFINSSWPHLKQYWLFISVVECHLKQFHRRYISHQSLLMAWKWIWNFVQISQGPMYDQYLHIYEIIFRYSMISRQL